MKTYRRLHTYMENALREERPKGFRGPSIPELRHYDRLLHQLIFSKANRTSCLPEEIDDLLSEF